MAVEDSNTKICTKCGDTKPKDEFGKDTSKRDGLFLYCRACVRVVNAKYRADHPEEIKAYSAEYSAGHKEQIKTADAARYAANPEKSRAYSAKYRAENPDKVKAAIVGWRADNPEAILIHNHNRRASKCANGGSLSKGLAERLFKLQRGKCACCKRPLGDDFHLDHIMPVALGGTNTDDNMQLLRKTCNLQKHAKHPVDFMQSRGLLL